MKLNIEIVNDRSLPAFAAFVAGSAKKNKIKFKVNIEPSIMANAEYGIDFYELMAEHTVHELLHVFQELYKKAFNEDEVNDAIEQAKQFIKENGSPFLEEENES